MTDQVEGKVEGADGGHHSARDPQGEAQLFPATWVSIQRDGLPVDPLGLLRRAHHGLNGATRLAATLRRNLPFLSRDESPHLFDAGRYQVGRLSEDLRALIGGELSHDLSPTLGEGQGPLHITAIPFGHRVDHRVVVGVSNLNCFSFIDPLPSDKHLHGQRPPVSLFAGTLTAWRDQCHPCPL